MANKNPKFKVVYRPLDSIKQLENNLDTSRKRILSVFVPQYKTTPNFSRRNR